MHDAAGLVLVHAEVNVVPGEVPRLRRAADDRPLDQPGERVRRAEIILRLVSEERCDIAECRGARAEHIGILDRVNELIELRWVKTVLQADVHGQAARQVRRFKILRRTRECAVIDRGRAEGAAFCERPVAARYGFTLGHDTIDGFVRMHG